MNAYPDKFRFSFVTKNEEGAEESYRLKYAPEEWNNNVIKKDRDKKTDVISTTYVDSFTFVLEDAQYLKEAFKSQSVFAKVRFVAEEYDGDTFEYKHYYSGDIDFYSYSETKYNVKVSVLEIGYKIAFDANYDTTYEIPPDSNNEKILLYNRLLFKNEISLSCDVDYEINRFTPSIVITPDIFEATSDVTSTKIQIESVVQEGYKAILFAKAVQSVENLNLNIQTDFTIEAREIGSGSVVKLILKVGQATTVLGTVTNEGTISNIAEGGRSFVYNISSGDEFYLYFEVESSSSVNQKVAKISGTGKINISYSEYTGSVKSIKCVDPEYLLHQLVDKATDGKYSKIEFRNQPSGILLTSGNLIRNIEGATIKTSLKDYFESIRAMFGSSYEFKNVNGTETLIVDHINNLYDKTARITAVSDIKNVQASVNNDYIYNRLTIGYKDHSYDEINGKFEFNTELQFSVPTDAKSKELKLVSPYRADMYGVEFLIINYEKKDTTDSSDDNDVFIFHVNEQKYMPGFYYLNRDYNNEASNLGPAGNSTYNVWLSPKRCALRQIEYIRSLFSFSGPVLKFASSPKEYNLISANGVSEHTDIDLSGDKLFDPLSIEFETKVPFNISELLGKSQNGFISADDGEKTINGFILSVAENPGRNKSQKWKLLKMA